MRSYIVFLGVAYMNILKFFDTKYISIFRHMSRLGIIVIQLRHKRDFWLLY